MNLDIIVPRYKEPWETCRYLFDTLATQEFIPFENVRVIMVNDGDEDVLDASCFQGYPFPIAYVTKPHGGVSHTRNVGLLKSTADYVMFCDCDDGFLSNLGLYLIFSAMAEDADFIISTFVEETKDEEGNVAIVRHDNDYTFMHGKVYKRQFLLDHELFFDEAMTIHEDGYFNTIVYSVTAREGKMKKIESPFYLWRWNPNSVVRRDSADFVLKTYGHLMQTRIGTADELARRGYDKELKISVCMTVLNSYYDFQKTSYTEAKNRVLKENAERAFKGFWKKYKKIFYDCTNMEIAEIAVTARATALKNGMLFEQQDLRTFLKHIDRDVKP